MAYSLFNTKYNLLDNYAIEFLNDPERSYIADSIAPRVPVSIDAKTYPIWGTETLRLSANNGVRARGAEAEKFLLSYSTGTYQTIPHAFELSLDDEDRDNAQPEFRVEEHYAKAVTARNMLTHEAVVAAKMFNVTTFAGYTAALTSGGTVGGYQWDNASSDPRVQVTAAKKSILLYGVIDPDQIELWINAKTFIALQNNATVLSTYKYTDPKLPVSVNLAGFLGVKAIHVGSGVYETFTGTPESPTVTRAQIWGNYALFGFSKQASDITDVSFAKTFVMKEKDLRLDSWYDQKTCSTYWRSQYNYDVECTAAGSGYLFSAVLGTP